MQEGVQVESSPADDDGRPAVATGLGQDGSQGVSQRATDGCSSAASNPYRRWGSSAVSAGPGRAVRIGRSRNSCWLSPLTMMPSSRRARAMARADLPLAVLPPMTTSASIRSLPNRSRDAGRHVPDRRPRAESARPTDRGRGGPHPRRRDPLARRSTGGGNHQRRARSRQRPQPARHADRGCARRPSGTAGGSSSQAAAAVRHGQHHHHHRVHRRAGRLCRDQDADRRR